VWGVALNIASHLDWLERHVHSPRCNRPRPFLRTTARGRTCNRLQDSLARIVVVLLQKWLRGVRFEGVQNAIFVRFQVTRRASRVPFRTQWCKHHSHRILVVMRGQHQECMASQNGKIGKLILRERVGFPSSAPVKTSVYYAVYEGTNACVSRADAIYARTCMHDSSFR
jgi:hypothetical protein